MKGNRDELLSGLIDAENRCDKDDIENYDGPYFILRRAILEFLGVSQQDLNEKVLDLEKP